MKLILTLLEGGSSLPEKDRARTLTSSGTPATLSIGRGPDNDWVLPSIEMNISRRHASIAFEGKRFVLTDCSTNGVHINRAPRPTERNSRVPLKDGDVIGVGNYVISVAVVEDAASANTGANANIAPNANIGGLANIVDGVTSGPAALSRDPLAEPSRRPVQSASLARLVATRRGADPFETQHRQSSGPIDPVVDHFDGIRPSADWHGLPTPDHAPAVSQVVVSPRVVTPRRVDFDALIGSIPGEAAVLPAGAAEPVKPAVPSPAPVDFAPGPYEQQNAATATPPLASADCCAAPTLSADPHGVEVQDEPGSEQCAGLAAFLDGAGLAMDRIDASDATATLHAAGQIFRALAEGFQQVLKSRAAVKSDMRIDHTIIAGVNNNPLKFSVTGEEAVRLLLTPEAPGYMDPISAARQAATDIETHELAVMAGMQAALLSLLHRFDPDELEKRLVAGTLRNLLPAARKARYWEAFRQTYQDLSREAEDEFQNAFGRPFARAYNAQARKE